VTGRELDALGREQVEEGIMPRRHRAMDRLDHILVLLRPGDRKHAGIGARDAFRLRAHAAGHDHLAVLIECLANGRERFCLGTVQEAAGIDQHYVRAAVVARELIAFGAQPRDDALAVDQRLGATERDEAHLRGSSGIHGDSS
jgi:hypothetical protein